MKRSFKISILITALAIPLATLHGVTLEYYMHKGKPLHGERIFQPVRGALVPSEVVALASFDQKNPFYSNETVVVRDGNTFRFGAILVGIGAYQSFYPVYISGLLPRQYPAHEIGKLSGNIFTRPVTPPQKTKEPTEPAPSKPTEPEEKKPETTEPTKPAPSKPIEPGEKKPETTEPTEPAPSKPTEPGEKKPEKAKGGDAWESEQEIPAETGKTINTVEILKEFITKTAKEQLMDASEAFISDIIRALGGQLTTEEALQMGYLPISETTIQKRIKQEVETELVRRDALRKAKEEKQADQKQDLFVEIPTSSDKKPAFFTLATLELFKKNQRAEREKTGKNVFISASTYRPVIEREDILLLDEGSYRDVLASWLYWKNKGRDLKEFLDDLAYGDAVSMNTLLADHDTVKNLLKTIGIEEATIQTFLKQNTDPISLEAVADFIRETKPKPETPAEPAIETKGPRAIGNSATPDDIAGAMYDGDNKFWPGEVVVIVRPNGTSWEYGEIIAEQNPGMYNVAFGPLKKLSGSIPAQSIGKLGPLYDNQKVLERASKSMSTQDYYNKLKSDEIITGLPAEFSGNNYDQITEVLGDDGKNLLHETSSSRHDRVTDYLAFEDGEEEIKNIVQNYKIHLMPKKEHINEVLARLIDAIRADHEFAQAIYAFKVLRREKIVQEREITSGPRAGEKYEEIVPIVVLYVFGGKENAQKALNVVYNLFKGVAGRDMTPRFNRKITPLIYYAQGHGDDKNEAFLHGNKDVAAFFEDDLIHFKPGITGKVENYHLTIPE